MDFKDMLKDFLVLVGAKNWLLIIGIGVFLTIGVAQQKYKKAEDQKAYEAECAMRAISKVASPCASLTRPGIPLPARGN